MKPLNDWPAFNNWLAARSPWSALRLLAGLLLLVPLLSGLLSALVWRISTGTSDPQLGILEQRVKAVAGSRPAFIATNDPSSSPASLTSESPASQGADEGGDGSQPLCITLIDTMVMVLPDAHCKGGERSAAAVAAAQLVDPPPQSLFKPLWGVRFPAQSGKAHAAAAGALGRMLPQPAMAGCTSVGDSIRCSVEGVDISLALLRAGLVFPEAGEAESLQAARQAAANRRGIWWDGLDPGQPSVAAMVAWRQFADEAAPSAEVAGTNVWTAGRGAHWAMATSVLGSLVLGVGAILAFQRTLTSQRFQLAKQIGAIERDLRQHASALMSAEGSAAASDTVQKAHDSIAAVKQMLSNADGLSPPTWVNETLTDLQNALNGLSNPSTSNQYLADNRKLISERLTKVAGGLCKFQDY